MFNTFIHFALPFAFMVFIACSLTVLVSGVALVLFKLRKTNELLKHPYLKHKPFDQYPTAIKTAILMDYFLRISFPKSQFWIIGDANRMLSHVEPKDIPMTIKWPLVGVWAGCFIGIVAMVIVWTLLFIRV